MAPDRGSNSPVYQSIPRTEDDAEGSNVGGEVVATPNDADRSKRDRRRSEARRFMKEHASEGQNFTLRGVLVGLAVGLLICFSNTYFGLQTGWISGMSMPSSLIGFAFFRSVARHLELPFTPVENVLVQTVAGSMGTMPVGCAFVGVMPAMNYLMTSDEGGPVVLSLWKLILWALGLCYFGVVFAVPLRRQVIIREKLKFPSGTATALMIGVLHGSGNVLPVEAEVEDEMVVEEEQEEEDRPGGSRRPDREVDDDNNNGNNGNNNDGTALGKSSRGPNVGQDITMDLEADADADAADDHGIDMRGGWKAKVRLLVIAFAVSALYTLATYFFPVLRNLPVFGTYLAHTWLWTLNPSLAYVGQGIIMGPETTLHMLLGALVGWAALSPLANSRGWAPGPVGDWETGSKGWIVWVSLAIMLADSVVSLGYVALAPLVRRAPRYADVTARAVRAVADGSWRSAFSAGTSGKRPAPAAVQGHGSSPDAAAHDDGDDDRADAQLLRPSSAARSVPMRKKSRGRREKDAEPEPADEVDAPPEHLVGPRTVWAGLALSAGFCVLAVHVVFGDRGVPLYSGVLAVAVALVLSVMGVRALGETDLNPVSGISKLAQLFFALAVPQSPSSSSSPFPLSAQQSLAAVGRGGGGGGGPNALLVNLVAGAVSEAGALQAGDLMQDLKTGHLLGAAPNAQFWGQIVGSTAGAVASALIYRLYTSVYAVPSDLFQVPTAYVWIFTARLVTGRGLPAMAWQWSVGAGVVFAVTTLVRTAGAGRAWRPWVPGGIAVAVGMYNVPSFTLARFIGGMINWYWLSYRGRKETVIVILASGLILGEGVASIANLLLASVDAPHL